MSLKDDEMKLRAYLKKIDDVFQEGDSNIVVIYSLATYMTHCLANTKQPYECFHQTMNEIKLLLDKLIDDKK